MISRIKCFINNKILDIKSAYRQYRYIYIAMLVCLCIGLIAGIASVKKDNPKFENDILIKCITDGSFKVILFYFKAFAMSSSLIIICFLLSFNYYVYFLNYLAVIFVSKCYFTYIITCCMVDGFGSVLLFITLWLPLLIIIMSIYIKFYISLLFLIFSCNKKYIIPYSSYWCSSSKLLGKSLLQTCLTVLIYLGIFFIILYLIC